jgi:hypothetical protein
MSGAKKEAMSILNFDVSTLGDCRKPVPSDQGSHDNAWLSGGSRLFTLSVPICRAVVDSSVDPGVRQDALKRYPRIMGELHLVGGDFSKPSDAQQSFLIQPPPEVVDKLNEFDDWAFDQYVAHQQEWFGQTKSLETVRDRQRAIWKPDKKNTGGAPCFNARGFQNKRKEGGGDKKESGGGGSTKVFVQSPDDYGDFEDNCTFKDIPKGSIAVITVEISGLRIKDDKFGLITPTIKEFYILAGGCGPTAPELEDGVTINIKGSSKAARELLPSAMHTDPGTATMVNVDTLPTSWVPSPPQYDKDRDDSEMA